MNLKQAPELVVFLSQHFSDGDPEVDVQVARDFAAKAPAHLRRGLVEQATRLLAAPALPLEEIGTEANRWFGDDEEARAWLTQIRDALQGNDSDEAGGGALVVKDSNGAVLTEGDSVMTIKDLKVRGGTSDLKRGTLIKKIHLIDDAENIECRVDGSTLVLKTCFLKKA